MSDNLIEELKGKPNDRTINVGKVEKLEDVAFPQRPPIKVEERTLTLATNLIRVRFRPKTSQYVFVYSINYLPDIDGNSKAAKQVLKHSNDLLKTTFGLYITIGNNLYSPTKQTNLIDTEVPINGQDNLISTYKLQIKITNQIVNLDDKQSDVKGFVQRIIKTCLNSNKGLIRFSNRSYYLHKQSKQIDSNIFF